LTPLLLRLPAAGRSPARPAEGASSSAPAAAARAGPGRRHAGAWRAGRAAARTSPAARARAAPAAWPGSDAWTAGSAGAASRTAADAERPWRHAARTRSRPAWTRPAWTSRVTWGAWSRPSDRARARWPRTAWRAWRTRPTDRLAWHGGPGRSGRSHRSGGAWLTGADRRCRSHAGGPWAERVVAWARPGAGRSRPRNGRATTSRRGRPGGSWHRTRADLTGSGTRLGLGERHPGHPGSGRPGTDGAIACLRWLDEPARPGRCGRCRMGVGRLRGERSNRRRGRLCHGRTSGMAIGCALTARGGWSCRGPDGRRL